MTTETVTLENVVDVLRALSSVLVLRTETRLRERLRNTPRQFKGAEKLQAECERHMLYGKVEAIEIAIAYLKPEWAEVVRALEAMEAAATLQEVPSDE